jgi:hypothetical protein
MSQSFSYLDIHDPDLISISAYLSDEGDSDDDDDTKSVVSMAVSNIHRQANLFSPEDDHFHHVSVTAEVADEFISEEEQWIYRYRTQRSASVDSSVPLLRGPDKKREPKRYSPLRSKSKSKPVLYVKIDNIFLGNYLNRDIDQQGSVNLASIHRWINSQVLYLQLYQKMAVAYRFFCQKTLY